MASTLDGDGISLDQVQELLDVVLDGFLQVVAVLEPGPLTPDGPEFFRVVFVRNRDLRADQVARLRGRTIADIWPDLASLFRAHALRAWVTGVDIDETVSYRDAGGDHISEFRARRRGDLLFVAARDVREQSQMRSRLYETETLLHAAFEEAPIGMAVGSLEADRFGLIMRSNVAWRRIVRADRSGQPTLVAGEEGAQRYERNLRALTAGTVESFRTTGRALSPAGGEMWLRITVAAVKPLEGPPIRFIAQVEDITVEREAEQELTRRALHDPLTGLANRLLLQERLEHALAVTARNGGVVALLYIDLNDFKVVNDERGHDVGDEVLRQVAQRLRTTVRASETPARLGGDEFAVVCEDLGNVSAAHLVAERIRAAIAVPVPLQGRTATITASVGVAVSVAGKASVADLFRAADREMYLEKAAQQSRPEDRSSEQSRRE
jgi:diguanylate cyclase (GGDEF)-like protein/PAS domain S-box-containing protein